MFSPVTIARMIAMAEQLMSREGFAFADFCKLISRRIMTISRPRLYCTMVPITLSGLLSGYR
ncbi:hypothetical protein [Endozoicomonas sp. NE40]